MSIRVQPPFCPDLVSAAPNQLLFAAAETNFIARQTAHNIEQLRVAIIVDDDNEDNANTFKSGKCRGSACATQGV
jgi:hypothetical protein